jgi:hypothetical protein
VVVTLVVVEVFTVDDVVNVDVVDEVFVLLDDVEVVEVELVLEVV